jgi:hypothetical protein
MTIQQLPDSRAKKRANKALILALLALRGFRRVRKKLDTVMQMGGIPGSNGRDGRDGRDGAGWVSGRGPPTGDIGKHGWFYLDETTGNVFMRDDL